MKALIVPQSPDQITSEWLEQALSETDPRAKPKIASIDISTLSRGPMGQTLRLVPAYRDDAADAPASLVAKMPSFAGSELPADRSLISMLYANEVNWYRELARECPIRVPRSYWTGADQANGRFCLLLEDLGHLRARTQLESCDEADARLVVRSLARFHAKWWDAASLGEHSWLRRPEQSGATLMQLWGLSWDTFKDVLGDSLTAEVIAIGERIGPEMLSLNQRGAASATTIVHGDVSLGNVMFNDEAEDDGLCVLDWQGVHLGSGPGDLGYFMGLSLTVELRRELEEQLLHLYHDTLLAHGVAGYGYEQCYDDYRIGLLVALAIPVNGTRMAQAARDSQRSNSRPAEAHPEGQDGASDLALTHPVIHRILTAILDTDAQAMLSP